jgi:hypothetical protein
MTRKNFGVIIITVYTVHGEIFIVKQQDSESQVSYGNILQCDIYSFFMCFFVCIKSLDEEAI